MVPALSALMVRSRWDWLMSPLMAAAAKPRALSLSATSSVACLVLTKTIIASKVSTSRILVSASILRGPATWMKRCVMFSAVDVFASILISTGSCRYFLVSRRIVVGIVAENRATCLYSGVSAKMRSTSSANPMVSISSASSSTR
ncbi:Uncharacterised protein [Mycobacteroides abscessus]|nr:Uncharacterised protein [Mycobacteroides abscessus]SKU24583.1 Uncharacterised protein [Mycobacteroides abscessus subsp. abscessus]